MKGIVTQRLKTIIVRNIQRIEKMSKKNKKKVDKTVSLYYDSSTLKQKGGDMKKLILVLIIMIIYITGSLSSAIVANLDDVMNPEFIIADETQLYVSEGTSVYIYSMKDFKLIRKFGKKGEGPREFIGKVQRIVPASDYILVNSQGKISFFKKNGQFIREHKTSINSSLGNYFPLDKGYVGGVLSVENRKLFSSVMFFDQQMNKGKTITKFPAGMPGKLDIFGMIRAVMFYVHKDRVYALNTEGQVSIYDANGREIHKLPLLKEKTKFTSAHETEIRKLMKKEMGVQQYEVAKNFFTFPKYFPELMTLFVEKGRVYLITFQRDQANYTTFIYSTEGKRIKQTTLHLKLRDGIRPYPFFIKDASLYQLIEDEETETWMLHQNIIK